MMMFTDGFGEQPKQSFGGSMESMMGGTGSSAPSNTNQMSQNLSAAIGGLGPSAPSNDAQISQNMAAGIAGLGPTVPSNDAQIRQNLSAAISGLGPTVHPGSSPFPSQPQMAPSASHPMMPNISQTMGPPNPLLQALMQMGGRFGQSPQFSGAQQMPGQSLQMNPFLQFLQMLFGRQ